MNVYFCLFLCILPFLACLIIFKKAFSVKISSLIISSILGLVCVLPITFLQFLIDFESSIIFSNLKPFLQTFLTCLIFFGFIEEILKTLLISFIPKKNVTFKQFFICSLIFGLCLACFESIVYFLNALQQANSKGAELIYHLIFIRFFTSDLIHVLCSALCGFFVYSCAAKKVDVLSLIMAILIHGLYDFFASFSTNIKYFYIIVILFAIIEVRIHYEKNKPIEIYKKELKPSKNNKDKTIETPLKDAPTYSE